MKASLTRIAIFNNYVMGKDFQNLDIKIPYLMRPNVESRIEKVYKIVE